jgi:hypothetical protein
MSLFPSSTSSRALPAFRLTLHHQNPRPRSYTTKPPSPDPLHPQIPTSPLGLPLNPLPSSIPQITPTSITRETFHRLHRLAALNPPPPDSEEEVALMSGLGELVGLMDLVKEVQLPDGDRDEMFRELLSEGVGEVIIDGSDEPLPTKTEEEREKEVREKSGRELLGWATRRVGDYYAHRVEKKVES